MAMTNSYEEIRTTVVDGALEAHRPLGPLAEERLREIAREAFDASPSTECAPAVVRAAVSIEVSETARVVGLFGRIFQKEG